MRCSCRRKCPPNAVSRAMGSSFNSSKQWVFTPCSIDLSRMSRAVSCASRVSPGGGLAPQRSREAQPLDKVAEHRR
eukprot:5438772-Prymnesium_polylepis.1